MNLFMPQCYANRYDKLNYVKISYEASGTKSLPSTCFGSVWLPFMLFFLPILVETILDNI